MAEKPLLSVIIPAYNEAATILALLENVLAAPYDPQVIVVDDGSTDGTSRIVKEWMVNRETGVDLLQHSENRGKGAAIRTGLERARGDIVLIQDADLEYDPADYGVLLAPILAAEADVVFGSRYLSGENSLARTANRVFVRLLNLMVRMLFGQRITDEATCYKVLRTDLLRQLDLRCERFEFCPEVTAKICRLGVPIREVPIRYRPRSAADGKKIRWQDGCKAIITLLYWRLAPFRPRNTRARCTLDGLPPRC